VKEPKRGDPANDPIGIMRAVHSEIRQLRIIVVGRVVTRILLGVFFTHSASYAQVSSVLEIIEVEK